MLRVTNIEKRYDGVHALKSVSASFDRGEIHALVGENGAGKSTLGKILAGAVLPDAGTIFVDDRQLTIHNPRDAQRYGISIIHQELDLFPNLSVAENIVIGNLNFNEGLFVGRARTEAFCRPYLDQVGLDVWPHVPVETLSIGQMQLVAIARSLSMNARFIVMDESTSSLTDDAAANLFKIMRKLRDAGVTIVYVSHKLDEIFAVCDRVTVLRDGCVVGTNTLQNVSRQSLVRMMVGRDVGFTDLNVNGMRHEVLLSVRCLSSHKLRNVSFDLHAGEVLGIAGLVGAGRSEIGKALFGLDHTVQGQMLLAGQPYTPRSPKAAIRRSLGLVPEDRKLQGLMMQMSVEENASIAVLSRTATLGVVRRHGERKLVDLVHQAIAVKTPSPDALVSTLSGGNQQKVLLARWLLVDPEVYFLDDPTRGIDIGAREDIYSVIRELVTRGKGVILVSSELPELLRCADRILVLRDGCNQGILLRNEATQERIMDLATHVAA